MNGYIQEMASLGASVPFGQQEAGQANSDEDDGSAHLKTLRLRRLGNGGSGGRGRGGNGTGMQLLAARLPSHLFSTSDLQRINPERSDWPSKDSKCPEFEPRDLIGHNLFDIVHPKDEQLVQPDSLQDLEGEQLVLRQYEDLDCCGFVHWPTTEASTSTSASASASSNAGGELKLKGGTAAAAAKPEPKPVGQLVLLCRPAVSADAAAAAVPARTRPAEAAARQFHARLTLEGRISWVDLRVTPLLGHLPQDLQDGSLYDLVSAPDPRGPPSAVRGARLGAQIRPRSRVTLQQCRLHSGWSNGEPACFANPLTQSPPEFLSLTGDAGRARCAGGWSGRAVGLALAVTTQRRNLRRSYFKEDQAQQDVNGEELNGEHEGEEATPQDEAFVDSGAPLPLMGQPF
uniref:PAS domain-containing protein n=1 Tax=Macrostomum lignano TaxID=282301 RepID=A0A1I8FMI3_9PLAT